MAAINPIGQTPQLNPANPAALRGLAAPKPGEMDFAGMLENVLGQLNDLAVKADHQVAQAAVGEDVDLHQVVVAMESAGMGFQLALQVRNKLLEAYQEIIRMQV